MNVKIWLPRVKGFVEAYNQDPRAWGVVTRFADVMKVDKSLASRWLTTMREYRLVHRLGHGMWHPTARGILFAKNVDLDVDKDKNQAQ